MLIKIKKGTYGHVVGKLIIPKTPHDEPFNVTAEQAKRLVALDVAEIIDVQPKETEVTEKETEHDLNAMTLAELKEMAAEYGLEYPKTAKKQDLITLISEAEEEPEEEPPTFDAAEAVQ